MAELNSAIFNFGIQFFEREGVYYAKYKEKIIFGGDKDAASKFIDDVENKADDDVRKMLDDLYNSKRKYRIATNEDKELIAKIRRKYGAGRKKNVAQGRKFVEYEKG